MTDLKLAFIGYGKHARANLYPSLNHLGLKLAAIATTHEDSAKRATQEQNVSNTFTDYRKMIETTKPDAVFVSVQAPQQQGIVLDCLRLGVHVFSEKPLGMTLNEANEVAQISEQTGKTVMVGFMKRYAPAFIKVKNILDSDSLGDVHSLSQFFATRNICSTPKEYLLFAAIHFIDLLQWYLEDLQEIKGALKTTESSLLMSYAGKTRNNALLSLQYCGSPSWERAAQEMTITAENGYIRTSGIDKVTLYEKSQKSTQQKWQMLDENEQTFGTMSSTGAGGLQALYLNGFIGEIDHFIKSIENGSDPLTSAKENVKTMGIVEELVNAVEK